MAQWRSPPTNVARVRFPDWVKFVVGSRPCSEGFSPGSQVFLPPQKPTFLNTNSTWNARSTLKRAPTALWCSAGKQITFRHLNVSKGTAFLPSSGYQLCKGERNTLPWQTNPLSSPQMNPPQCSQKVGILNCVVANLCPLNSWKENHRIIK